MIVLVFATLIGGTATLSVLLPYSVWIALVAAPFGGSASCALAGAVLYALRSKERGSEAVQNADSAFQLR